MIFRSKKLLEIGLMLFTVVSGLTALAVFESAAMAQEPARKTLYTCGMHPEVISDEPGLCPKCHMKLTPMDPDRAQMILEARGETVSPGPAGGKKERKILYWRAPMDPTYIRNEPGKSPMGMDLVPVYEDEVAGGPTIRIDPVTEQNMGMRYDTVSIGPVEKTVRTVGTIDYSEHGLATVSTKVAGWVEKVHVDQTGAQVHAGDPLFDLYAPELYSAQEEYLQAVRDSRAGGDLATRRQESARERLRLFDISEAQIEALQREGKVKKALTLAARATGIVTEKNIVEGDYIEAGQTVYKIGDLSTVWVIGRVFESDLPFVQVGQEARMRLDYLPGREYIGRVTYVYPYLTPGTREIPVRVEFHNPGYDLKPGMYATLHIRSRIAEAAVLAPTMAVIDTGERQVAFVTRGEGKFEPRRVELGVRTEGNRVQILSGLAPGEHVVVSGQFLLDSESRLREATLKMLGTGYVDTSRILESATTATAMTAAHGEMVAETGKYVCPMPAHAGILYDASGDCPLCAMKLVPVSPWHKQESPVAYYTCPMPEHADVRSETPGKCPECGMTLIPVTEADIERAAGAAAETIYTCPMASHADVVSNEPGDCVKCGMKLVPTSQVEHGAQSEGIWRAAHPGGMVEEGSGEAGNVAETIYTCPMASHADVVSNEPGDCVKCGMKLVPTSQVEHGSQSESIWRAAHPTPMAEQGATSATAQGQ